MSVLDFEAQWCRAELERMKREGSLQFEGWFGEPAKTIKDEVDMGRDIKAEAEWQLKVAESLELEAKQRRVQAQALLDAHEKFIQQMDEDKT